MRSVEYGMRLHCRPTLVVLVLYPHMLALEKSHVTLISSTISNDINLKVAHQGKFTSKRGTLHSGKKKLKGSIE